MRWLRALWHRHVDPPPSAESIDQETRVLDELHRTVRRTGAIRDPQIRSDLAALSRDLERMREQRRRVTRE